MTVLGTRPEIIRLSLIIPLLDESVDHTLVHTGQNFEPGLSDLFFDQFRLRQPDKTLQVRGSFGAQIASILTGVEDVIREIRPDRLLILGDTNSGLSALAALRMGVDVYHLEAGNRCYDNRVPEEINRRVIDHSSTVLLPYTNRSRDNLLREGIPDARIFTVGNPIGQVISRFAGEIEASGILERLGLAPRRFFLATAHRAENVDAPSRLRDLLDAFSALSARYGFPVVCSVHPRTASRLREFGVEPAESLILVEPLGFFDFIRLEQAAFCCLTDSGTVQEETCILHIPNVTTRDVTERPETVDCGSNVLAGTDSNAILAAVERVTASEPTWTPPAEYLAENVAQTVCAVMTSERLTHAGPGIPAGGYP